MMMKPLFAMMANYNAWANARLYDAAAALPDEDFRREEGAAFGSLCGTLNHLVVGDMIWLSRFTGEGEAPGALDGIVAKDLAALRVEREALDERYRALVAKLSEADLLGTFSYRTIVRPQEVTQPLAPALMHAFNHQTHHRGQAHALLTRLAGEAPSLDLIYYQRESGEGLS